MIPEYNIMTVDCGRSELNVESMLSTLKSQLTTWDRKIVKISLPVLTILFVGKRHQFKLWLLELIKGK